MVLQARPILCFAGQAYEDRRCREGKYGMGSRKYMPFNRWKRARKGLLQGAEGQLQGILN